MILAAITKPERVKTMHVRVDYAHILESDQKFYVCYVCATPHKAFGLARIYDTSGTIDTVPLCEPCLADDECVLRKFLNAPDLEIIDGGEATTEQVLALVEKQDVAEH